MKLTIARIKRLSKTTSPHFFTRSTLKFFGQHMRDFKVIGLNQSLYIIAIARGAPEGASGASLYTMREVLINAEGTEAQLLSVESAEIQQKLIEKYNNNKRGRPAKESKNV